MRLVGMIALTWVLPRDQLLVRRPAGLFVEVTGVLTGRGTVARPR